MQAMRVRTRSSVLRTLAASSMVCIGLACSSEHPEGAEPGPWPLPNDAPLLSCERLVEVDAECHRAADCENGELCAAAAPRVQDDRAPLVLTCSKPLGAGSNRDRCQSGEDCETGICALSDVCLSPCTADADCEPGQACRRVEAHAGQGLAPLMACARTLAFADNVNIATSKLTKVAGGRVTTLQLPAGDDNALVYLYLGCEAQGEVRALRRRGSDDAWFELSELLAGRGARNPLINIGSLIPALIPNNPELTRGNAAFELDLYSDLSTDVRTVTVSRSGEHEQLDLNVYYVGGGEERSEGGLHPGSEEVRQLLQDIDKRLRVHELRLGELREHDVTGALRDELSVLETKIVRDEEGNAVDLSIEGLEELFALSAGSDDGGVNLFLVSDMGDVLGISGGIPGALGVSGTAASGVAIAVDVAGLAGLDGVLLHELSHQLGLFHTSEFNGFVTEPLDDTPACGRDRDDNGDGILVGSECAGAGADNLMFWSGTGSRLTAQQSNILRRSPVLR